MPEYCEGYGIEIKEPDDVKAALMKMRENYAAYRSKMAAYPHTAAQMTRDWIAYFEESLTRRNALVKKRRLWRNPVSFLLNQIPL
jgi:hypothetical protein